MPVAGKQWRHRARAQKLSATAASQVHQAALADRQSEEIGERALQAFVGQSLECLEIGRHGMDARPERRACRRVRQRRGDDHSARRAAHRKAPVALDHWMDLGKFDGLVLACRLGGQVLRELGLATGALTGTMVDLTVERLTHGAGVALVAGLAPPGLALSRRSLRSVAGGFDDVRDVFSGRCSRSNRSISSSFDSRCKSPRSIPPRIQLRR